jgi:hypothetical protein
MRTSAVFLLSLIAITSLGYLVASGSGTQCGTRQSGMDLRMERPATQQSCDGRSPTENVAAGAELPFVTHEAEDAILGQGAIVTKMNSSNIAAIGSSDLPVTEASGRAYATLNSLGQSITFEVTRPANAINVRYNIPYRQPYNERTGPGATLHLWVNNEAKPREVRQILYTSSGASSQLLKALALSSYHNEPNTAFWEESRAFISGRSLQAGDKIRLEAAEGDVGFPYNIDSIDLEQVPFPLAQPTRTYSVKDFGAFGDGIHDDSAAIQNTIDQAEVAGKNVWLPPGIYCQSAQFSIRNVKVYGAGMWHTNLVCIYDPGSSRNFNGCMGFILAGDGDEVHDMTIDSAVHVSRTNGGKGIVCSKPGPTKWVVQNVWITHSIVAMWINNDSYGLASNCRVHFSYADGIHLDGNCNHDTIFNCHIRGAGDDGIAILSLRTSNYIDVSHDNSAVHNTVIANWSAANCDLAGGYNNSIISNYFADSDFDGSLVINMPGTYPMYDTTGATIANNLIVRGGGDIGGQRRGAIWIWPNYGYPENLPAITNVIFDHNRIIDSLWRGVLLYSRGCTQSTSFVFSNNVISGVMAPQGDGIDVAQNFPGAAVFTNNSLSAPYRNFAPDTFIGTGWNNTPAFSFP